MSAFRYRRSVSLAELFVGATASATMTGAAKNQVARIYRTELVTEKAKPPRAAKRMSISRGFAYMLRTEANTELIAQIEGGIKRAKRAWAARWRRAYAASAAPRSETCSHRKRARSTAMKGAAPCSRARLTHYRMELCCRSGAEKRGRYKKLHRKRSRARLCRRVRALKKSPRSSAGSILIRSEPRCFGCASCAMKNAPALEKSVQLMEEPELIKLKDAFEEASASSIRP